MVEPTEKAVISITVRQLIDGDDIAYAADITGKITGLVLGETLAELMEGVKLTLEDL